MKQWFLGKEIPYFKPLKSELDRQDISKLSLSNTLKNVNQEEVLSNLYNKGFLDPNFPNYIRTSTQLFLLENLVIVSIFNLKEVKDFNLLPKKELLPSHYIDFIKDQTLLINEREGFSLNWIEEDLRYKGSFIEKIEEHYIFETEHFRYYITSDFKIEKILYNKNLIEITKIQWSKEHSEITLKDNSTITLKDYYIEWLSNLEENKEIKLPAQLMKESIAGNEHKYSQYISLDLHPEIVKMFYLDSEKEKLFKEMISLDIYSNGMTEIHPENEFIVKGWKFRYTWKKGTLHLIELPSKCKIQSVVWEETQMVLNKKQKIPINKFIPEKITDLFIGNNVSILPENALDILEFHPHAVQRYSQRIDSKAFLSQMLKDVIYNSYNFGEIVEGAHTNDRRKVETSQFGYVISDTLVISVWDKLSSKRKK